MTYAKHQYYYDITITIVKKILLLLIFISIKETKGEDSRITENNSYVIYILR